ncbi:MAG: hypothetical protein O2966_05225 [Proteobacteria bacterium]|nr:hypothetical protein [Pseudomonadota bacterium]
MITKLDLELPAASNGIDGWKGVKERAVSKVEQAFLETALKAHQGDVKKVAENMSITSRAVYGKLKKYELNLVDFRKA